MPKYYGYFDEMPILSIEPQGWLRRYLENQKRGLTGHIEASGFPYDTEGWADKKLGKRTEGIGWWPYEQTGYWVDGALKTACLLEDIQLHSKASKQIKYVLKHQAKDGFLGPDFMRKKGVENRWAQTVFFRALMTEESAREDGSVAEAVCAHYLSDDYVYDSEREATNIEGMVWAYLKTGKKKLLKLAEKTWQEANKTNEDKDFYEKGIMKNKSPYAHGVTYNEVAKLGSILFLATGETSYLNLSIRAYEKLDKYHMMVDGVNSSSEHLDGKSPLATHETCDIADYTWSVGYLLMATGNASYADKIERACFNAAVGAVKNDFTALQYFSGVNQTIAGTGTNQGLFGHGNNAMTYSPSPFTQCCPGEVNRIMPNYASRMWLKGSNNEITAALYGPSCVTFEAGKETVSIVETTNYPFSEEIDFEIRAFSSATFAFCLRLPSWCKKPRLLYNGVPVNTTLKPGTFVTIEKTFSPNDRVTLVLPMELSLNKWKEGGVYVERGPLLYSLKIDEKWEVSTKQKTSTESFPAYEVSAKSDWNYALSVNTTAELKKRSEIIFSEAKSHTWDNENPPITIKVPARKIKNWKIEKHSKIESKEGYCVDKEANLWEMRVIEKKGSFQFTPDLPSEEYVEKNIEKEEEMISLIPYGCTHLRITLFPQAPASKKSEGNAK